MHRLILAAVAAAAVILAPAVAHAAPLPAPTAGYGIPQPVRAPTPVWHPSCSKPAPKAAVCKVDKPHPCRSNRPGVRHYGEACYRYGPRSSDLPPIH